MEILAFHKWLRALLAADTTLKGQIGVRLFKDFVPEIDPKTGKPPVYPLCFWHVERAPASRGMGATRIAVPVTFRAWIIGTNGAANLETAYGRLDVLLQTSASATASVSTVTYNIQGCELIEALDNADIGTDGVRHDWIGGRYQTFVSRAS